MATSRSCPSVPFRDIGAVASSAVTLAGAPLVCLDLGVLGPLLKSRRTNAICLTDLLSLYTSRRNS